VTDRVIELVITFLGGGLVVAVLDWIRTARSEMRQREILYLQDQLRLLYGPLHMLLAQNEKLMQFGKRIHDAYRAEFFGKKFAESSQQTVDDPAHRTIELANAYGDQVRENNARIMELIEKNWSLVDIEDFDTLSQFQLHHIRMRLEFEQKMIQGITFLVREHLGEITFFDSDFVKRFADKRKAKQERLASLLNPGWWRRRRGP